MAFRRSWRKSPFRLRDYLGCFGENKKIELTGDGGAGRAVSVCGQRRQAGVGEGGGEGVGAGAGRGVKKAG